MAFLLCFSLAILLVGVTADAPEKLIRATNAANNAYPYMATIKKNDRHICGGAIISPTHILTAAHCVHSVKRNANMWVSVSVGSNQNWAGSSHRIVGFYMHPKYDHYEMKTAWDYDVGVLKLATPIKFGPTTQPIPLPTGPPPYDGNATITGWGATAWPAKSTSPNLLKLDLKILRVEDCQSRFSFYNISSIHICGFKEAGTGTCSGDSGSPLIANKHVIGVVSGGVAPCADGYPDIFTNLWMMLDFIKDVMKY